MVNWALGLSKPVKRVQSCRGISDAMWDMNTRLGLPTGLGGHGRQRGPVRSGHGRGADQV